jgi:inhibitor of KinA
MPTIHRLGDSALTIQYGEQIDADTNHAVLLLFEALRRENLPGVKDLIPAYSSLTVVYDPILTRQQSGNTAAFDFLSNRIGTLLVASADMPATSNRLIEVPVSYEPDVAPDLEYLSQQLQLTTEEIIRLHLSCTYRVFMTGFLPGFAYMGTVDPAIACPRKMQPRILVPAGSVGIAGLQTGIYPFDSPGGWNIIGRTTMRLFDPDRPDPVLFHPGDTVRFVRA